MSTIHAINPATLQTKSIDFNSEQAQELLAGAKGFIERGAVTIHVMSNGNRIIAGKGAVGPDFGEAALAMADYAGKFAVIATPYEDGGETAFSQDAEGLTEIIGPVIVVGPGEGTEFTPVVGGEDFLKRSLGFNVAAFQQRELLAEVLAQALGADLSDNDNDMDRSGISEEDLAECGCEGCKDELAQRAVEAGGSRAVN